jgi:methyltransferase (TIGR00027 family)
MARTDNDTWDLASSVGATATMVAAQRAFSHREGLIDDPFAEPLVRAVGLDFFTRALDGEIELEDVDPEFNMRRAAEGMTVRTRWFDELFTDAFASGVRQAVILAAGLDARAYRLDWPAGTNVYELDQPKVIDFKTKTLTGLGARPKADRHPIAIDLRSDWPKALLNDGFDPEQPTAWIAEGPADLPAARGTGPVVRPDQRAQRSRQPGSDRTHCRHQHVLRRARRADR